MKRTGGLIESIADGGNLRVAFWKASRGKRETSAQRAFAENLDGELEMLRAEILGQQTLRVGEFTQFTIYDPKKRLITAPCFRERVLHHALMNVCGPVFERSAIFDSYASRQGKGNRAAIARAQGFARRFGYFLKLDIRHYFDSIPHDRVMARLKRLFREQRLLEIWQGIVDSHNVHAGITDPEEADRLHRGLPIGSLCSQYFANFYLDVLDRFVKEVLQVEGYVRFMDDFVLWHDSRDILVKAVPRIESVLRDDLGLELKHRSSIQASHQGMDFLGYRVFPWRIGLNRRSRRRFVDRLRHHERKYMAGDWAEAVLQRRVEALVAFTQQAACIPFRRRVIAQFGSLTEKL